MDGGRRWEEEKVGAMVRYRYRHRHRHRHRHRRGGEEPQGPPEILEGPANNSRFSRPCKCERVLQHPARGLRNQLRQRGRLDPGLKEQSRGPVITDNKEAGRTKAALNDSACHSVSLQYPDCTEGIPVLRKVGKLPYMYNPIP